MLRNQVEHPVADESILGLWLKKTGDQVGSWLSAGDIKIASFYDRLKLLLFHIDLLRRKIIIASRYDFINPVGLDLKGHVSRKHLYLYIMMKKCFCNILMLRRNDVAQRTDDADRRFYVGKPIPDHFLNNLGL